MRMSQTSRLEQDAHKSNDRAFVDVLRDEQLPQQLQDIILYALAFADAAQTPPAQHSPAQSSQVDVQGRQEQFESGPASSAVGIAANSAATFEQQAPAQMKSCSSSSLQGVVSTPQQQFTRAVASSAAEASSGKEDSVHERNAGGTRSPVSQAAGDARDHDSSSRGLMSHSEGIESLAKYMGSAGRSVLLDSMLRVAHHA